ncbi:hypothetical protein KPL71_026667 [Citrus sinensis]|uniref:Uncharacterized protein n=1 Tax=Citrus sinensis TaxID=2711 RepID=A0ACB8I0X9_CITSI|nr:hypothetical protein KPL71_026667 [Citrus sinensis]
MISKSTNKENDGQVGLDEEEVDNGPNKLRQGPKIENGNYKPEIQRLQELTEAEQDAREFLEAMYEDSSAGADRFSSKNMKNWVSDHCPIAFEVKERGSVVKHTTGKRVKTGMSLVPMSLHLVRKDFFKFAGASRKEATDSRPKVFDCYAEASRQIFNFDKSSMFFSRKIAEGQVAVIKDTFKLNVVTRGKEILINAAAQAVPAYAMSVFKLPKGLYDEIQRAYMMIFKGLQQSFGRVQKMTNKAFIGQGNGKNVLVYKDNWLPRLDTFKPISSRTLLEDTAVADLMNIENQWDEDKLNQHFVYEDIEMILKIPIPQENS